MSRQYNYIYDKLVTDDADIAGAIAYSLYKKEKQAFIENFKQQYDKDPEEEDIASFHQIVSTPTNIDRLSKLPRQARIPYRRFNSMAQFHGWAFYFRKIHIFATSTIINQILIIMKKVLFIIAVLSVTFAANAQSVQFYSTFDTLSTVQLRQEIVNLNNGVADFRNDYLIGVGLQVGGSVLAGRPRHAGERTVGRNSRDRGWINCGHGRYNHANSRRFKTDEKQAASR